MAAVNVVDVAEYILTQTGTISTMKLQKLVYYSQAWSLAWDGDVLFNEEIEAWVNGPVVRSLYVAHKGMYQIGPGELPGADSSNLDQEQKDTIDTVLDYYGDKSPQWLSDLTHDEDPWRNAREGIPERVRADRIISKDSLSEYYSSL